MDLAKALAELREQRDAIDQAILSLERLAKGSPRGRGRPPGRTTGHPKKRSATVQGSGDRPKVTSD